METFRPGDRDELKEVVSWAAAERAPLAVSGNGSKAGLGRPVEAAHRIDLSRLSGVLLYEPEELVISAKAGTPLTEVEAALKEKGAKQAETVPRV